MLSFMRVWCVCLVLATSATGPFAQGTAGGAAAIDAVISRQLEALNKGDGEAAFAIASPSIQSIFQTPQNFIGMVERGFPELRHASGHRLLKLETVEGAVVARVLVESPSGNVIARYEMIEIDGSWRINGCSLEARQDA